MAVRQADWLMATCPENIVPGEYEPFGFGESGSGVLTSDRTGYLICGWRRVR